MTIYYCFMEDMNKHPHFRYSEQELDELKQLSIDSFLKAVPTYTITDENRFVHLGAEKLTGDPNNAEAIEQIRRFRHQVLFCGAQRTFKENIMQYGSEEMKANVLALENRATVYAAQQIQKEAVLSSTMIPSIAAKLIVMAKNVVKTVTERQKQLNKDSGTNREKTQHRASNVDVDASQEFNNKSITRIR